MYENRIQQNCQRIVETSRALWCIPIKASNSLPAPPSSRQVCLLSFPVMGPPGPVRDYLSLCHGTGPGSSDRP